MRSEAFGPYFYQENVLSQYRGGRISRRRCSLAFKVDTQKWYAQMSVNLTSESWLNQGYLESSLFVSDQSPTPPASIIKAASRAESLSRSALAVVVPPVLRRWEYQVYNDDPFVREVLEEYDNSEGVQFLTRLSDGSERKVSYKFISDEDHMKHV